MPLPVTLTKKDVLSSINESDDEIIRIITEEVQKALGETRVPIKKDQDYPSIPLGVSNRHIHITQETFSKLFGAETIFESERPLYQPGEFASKHYLSVIGPKMRALQNVRILGPMRKFDQVEISLSDAIFLGIDAPVRNSGDLRDAAALTLVGPQGSIFLKHCAIVASRHIHMTSEHAKIFGVSNGEYCRVRIPGIKGIIFENVLIRVNDDWKLQMHLDTDDANAANVRDQVEVEFIGKM